MTCLGGWLDESVLSNPHDLSREGTDRGLSGNPVDEEMKPFEAATLIKEIITREVSRQDLITTYREPIIGFLSATDPGFDDLGALVGFIHDAPASLLPGARSVVCFFLPFSADIARANQVHKESVARQWAVAYQETNTLIGQVTSRLIEELGRVGIRAAAEPATGNFDHESLKSRWSHKSLAVMAGIGSFGLHQLVITDAGCTGRFGSLVVDIDLPIHKPPHKERCLYYANGDCLDCVLACPVAALDEDEPFDRRACWNQCLKNGDLFLDIADDVHVCGKCAVMGPCALESAV
jgi:epoxyqueuosine reductase QueG